MTVVTSLAIWSLAIIGMPFTIRLLATVSLTALIAAFEISAGVNSVEATLSFSKAPLVTARAVAIDTATSFKSSFSPAKKSLSNRDVLSSNPKETFTEASASSAVSWLPELKISCDTSVVNGVTTSGFSAGDIMLYDLVTSPRSSSNAPTGISARICMPLGMTPSYVNEYEPALPETAEGSFASHEKLLFRSKHTVAS